MLVWCNRSIYHSNHTKMDKDWVQFPISTNIREVINVLTHQYNIEVFFMYKRAISFGSFEYVHIGHITLFQRIKEQCEELVVCVSDDEYIEKTKGHKPVFTLYERIKGLSSIKEIDYITVQSVLLNKERNIKLMNPNVIFVGDDWNPKNYNGEGLGIPVIYLPRTKGVSSTELREKDL